MLWPCVRLSVRRKSQPSPAQPITVVCKATRVYMPILGGVVWTFYHLLCKNGWTDRRQSLKPTPIHAKCCWWTVGWHRSLIIYWLAAKFLLGHNYEFTMHWLRRRVVSFVCERVGGTIMHWRSQRRAAAMVDCWTSCVIGLAESLCSQRHHRPLTTTKL